jgi:hypothetical protein
MEKRSIGKYVAKHNNMVMEYLELYSSGKYYHYVIEKQDTVSKNYGKWGIEGTMFNQNLILYDFTQYFDMVDENKIKPRNSVLHTYCDGYQIGGFDTPEYKYFRVDK